MSSCLFWSEKNIQVCNYDIKQKKIFLNTFHIFSNDSHLQLGIAGFPGRRRRRRKSRKDIKSQEKVLSYQIQRITQNERENTFKEMKSTVWQVGVFI